MSPWLYGKVVCFSDSTYPSRLPIFAYKVLSESFWTVVVTASVKEDERGGQGHTSESILHQSATWHRAVNMHCFYTSAFSTLCFILSAIDGKIVSSVYIKFCIHVSRPVECQLKVTNVQGDQAPAKQQKMFRKFENSSTETVVEQSVSLQTRLGSVIEFARRS
jgi:uncharacterized protein with PQ loop repeat